MPTIEERYRSLHPTSDRLYQEARGHFPDGVTHDTRPLHPFPVFITHAHGSRKWDVDGHEYVDYVSGHGALLLGHAHPAIVQAVAEQVARGTHYGASHELELRWAELVKTLIPSAEKVRFTSSGTEATMMALRLARAYTARSRVIMFQDHFHGWSDGLLASSSQGTAGIPSDTLSTMTVLPPNNIAAVARALSEHDDVAAVILEPTGAHMGTIPIEPAYLHELREVTQRYGVILIFDEVVTGFRTSPGGAQARYGVLPDLTALAKVLGGGLPAGAVASRGDILDMIEHRQDFQGQATPRVAHPGTFNANPLSAAAGIACLELVATGEPNARADAIAQRLRYGLNDLLARLEIPGCVYGVASLFHLALGRRVRVNEGSGLPYPEDVGGALPGLNSTLKRACLNAGVDLMGGSMGLVSSAHTEEDVGKTLAAFEEALAASQQEGAL